MKSCSPSSLIPAVVVSAAVALGTSYFMAKHESKKPFEDTKKEEIQKIFMDFLRDKPDSFIGAVNEGVQGQQDKLRLEIEKNANTAKDQLFSSGITLGTPKSDVRFVSFVDPMCPHCHEFMKLALTLVQKRQDFSMNIIPVAILGPNSGAVGRTMIAASLQGVDKFKLFMEKFIDKAAELDRAKLLLLAKEAGLDVARLEKDEASEATEKTLTENVKLFDSLKAAGVPTVFGGKQSDDLMMIPPMDLDSFSKLIDSIKEKTKSSAGTTEPATSPASTQTPLASKADQAAAGTAEVKKDGK
jgi:protein-disulfide isomerase